MLWSWKDPKPALTEFARELSCILKDHARNVASRLAPKALKQWILARRRLGPFVGLIYGKRRLGRALGLIRDSSRRLPNSVKTILFVCHGNIMRSPTAAALLKKSIGEPCSHSIVSAGLFAKDSKPADPRAQIVAERLGISLDHHRAQRLTADLVEQANVIFVMDFENEAVLLDRFPKANKKTFLLGALPTEAPSPSVEIPDPYDGDLVEVQRCFDRINDHIRGLVFILSCKS
jgi:protein-tyrosine phosphatase